MDKTDTYDHRLVKAGHPVRSGIHKHKIGWLVVDWVTISESQLLYVLVFLLDFWSRREFLSEKSRRPVKKRFYRISTVEGVRINIKSLIHALGWKY